MRRRARAAPDATTVDHLATPLISTASEASTGALMLISQRFLGRDTSIGHRKGAGKGAYGTAHVRAKAIERRMAARAPRATRERPRTSVKRAIRSNPGPQVLQFLLLVSAPHHDDWRIGEGLMLAALNLYHEAQSVRRAPHSSDWGNRAHGPSGYCFTAPVICWLLSDAHASNSSLLTPGNLPKLPCASDRGPLMIRPLIRFHRFDRRPRPQSFSLISPVRSATEVQK